MSDRFQCSSCSEPKFSVKNYKSKVTGMEILMCKTCIDKGFEPRELLIIGYHSNSNDTMRRKAKIFIKNGLYVGEPISVAEVL